MNCGSPSVSWRPYWYLVGPTGGKTKVKLDGALPRSGVVEVELLEDFDGFKGGATIEADVSRLSKER